ncbi:MAG: hypothetical protein PHY99_04100 [Bacteroidales bacterium]|nr:hypothetical protein [Bacteroidales bacterium]
MEILKPYILPFLICVVFSLAVSNHAIMVKSGTKKLRNLLVINSMVGFAGNLAFLIFYGIHTAWQYPVVLGIGGYIAGGIIWATLNRVMGAKAQFVLSIPAMIGYPIAIFVCFSKLLITV